MKGKRTARAEARRALDDDELSQRGCELASKLEGLSPDDVAGALRVMMQILIGRSDAASVAGLEAAYAIATRALVGAELGESAATKAPLLGAVARGVRVRSMTQDLSWRIRELADAVDVAARISVEPPTPTRADALAAWIEVFHGQKADPVELETALARRSRAARVAGVALAFGFFGDNPDRRRARDTVRTALDR
jgi:hypothetical protein